MPLTEWWRGRGGGCGTQTKFPQNVKRFHWIIQIRFDFLPLKQKSDKTKQSFIPPTDILRCHGSHPVCWEN